MQWLYKLERKYGRFCIPNLMIYICITMLCVFLMDNVVGINISALLSLNRYQVLHGQVWRLITFIFVPPANGILTILFALYFYYFIGTSLENAWGSFQFNLYYLCGMVGLIIAALISGRGSNTYLNLSLFLAFAMLYPDERILLFFILPIKVKWLAYIDAALYAMNLILGLVFRDWPTVLSILFSLVNFAIFFGPGFIKRFRDHQRYSAVRRNWRNQMRK